jgi:hypothetical protein
VYTADFHAGESNPLDTDVESFLEGPVAMILPVAMTAAGAETPFRGY